MPADDPTRTHAPGPVPASDPQLTASVPPGAAHTTDDSARTTGLDTGRAARPLPHVPGYELLEELGRGGMGVVYKARHVKLDRLVALKMVLAGEYASAAQLERFLAEARAVAQLRHPNVVQLYEIGEHAGLPYISLEYCPGGSLDRKLARTPQPPRQAAELVAALADAVAVAHRQGVVHRDIKPANVLLDADGTPKVTDFGLAKAVEDDGGRTVSGTVLGSPSYMSPEQARGDLAAVGPASDQYGLGATLYDLLTGRPPFQGTSVVDTLEQVRTREPAAPSLLAPGVPRDLETICLKTLQKEPAKRYPDCAALAADLRAFLDGRAIAARPVGMFERGWRWARRNPRVAGLVAAIAALLVLLAGGGLAAAVVFDQKKREAEGLAEDRRRALELAEARRAEADESYQLAREAVIGVAWDIPDILRQAQYARAAQEKVVTVLADALDKQLAQAATRNLADRAVHAATLKLGDLRYAQGKWDEAEKHYADAFKLSERMLAPGQTETDKAKGNHAASHHKLGLLARDGRLNMFKALEHFGEAEKLHREVVEKPTTGEVTPAEAKLYLSNALHEIADVYERKQEYDAALKYAEAAVKLRAEVTTLPQTRNTRGAAALLADSLVLLGEIQFKRGKNDEAAKAMAEAVAIYQKELPADPQNLNLRRRAATANRSAGDFLLQLQRYADAEPYHVRDRELTTDLLRIPEIVNAQSDLSRAYYRSGTLALKRGDREVALGFYRKCVALRREVTAAQPWNDFAKLALALALARAGEYPEAVAVLEGMRRRFPRNLHVAVESATTYGLCADAVLAGRKESELPVFEAILRRGYLAAALDSLDRATSYWDWRDVVRLRTDPDFDPIRPDPRFAEAVRRVEERLTHRPKKD